MSLLSAVASILEQSYANATPADPAFKMLVVTNNTGPSDWEYQFTLQYGYTYNFTVDWGDGNVEVLNNALIPNFPNVQHVYHTSGNKTISITENVVGGFAGVQSDSGWGASKILQITNWGTNTWFSFDRAFSNCVNLVITATDSPTITTGSDVNFTEAFKQCRNVTAIPMMNTSRVTDFTDAWNGCTGLTSFPLLNTSRGYRFSNTWRGCTSLSSFPLINVNLGQYFDSTWRDCTSLHTFPTVVFNTMTDGSDCFNGCTLTTTSYSNLLISLRDVNPQTMCAFHGGSSKYNSTAVAARDYLTNGEFRLWTITDGGLE